MKKERKKDLGSGRGELFGEKKERKKKREKCINT